MITEALSAMPYWYGACLLTIFGAVIGSFLNVLVYRLPRGISIVTPRSHCPRCKHVLAERDLVPLLSWIAQGGKCRYCKAPISPRYMLIEGLTALLFLATFNKIGYHAELIPTCLFISCLVAAFFIDLECFIIPDSLNFVALMCGAIVGIIRDTHAGWAIMGWYPPLWLVSASASALVFIGIANVGRILYRRDAMGFGDVKLARAIGAMLPLLLSMMSFAVAIAVGTVIGVAMIMRNRKKNSSTGDDDKQTPADTESLSIAQTIGYSIAIFFWVDIILDFVNWVTNRPEPKSADEPDEVVGSTTIPFGPFMVIGAFCMVFFGDIFTTLWTTYWRWATGG